MLNQLLRRWPVINHVELKFYHIGLEIRESGFSILQNQLRMCCATLLYRAGGGYALTAKVVIMATDCSYSVPGAVFNSKSCPVLCSPHLSK